MAGFFYVIGNDEHSQKYQNFYAEVMDHFDTLNHTKANYVNYFDIKSIVLVVSMEPSSVGAILSATNSHLLGYGTELIGSDISILVPPPI